MAAEPTQLTYGGGQDAAWTGDGSAIVYSGFAGLRQLPDSTQDVCLGVLPATGGQIRRTIWQLGIHQLDSIDAMENPAVSPGDRLVFLHSSQLPLQRGWSRRELLLASVEDPTTRRVLATVPQFGIASHNGLTRVQWLDDQRFVYLALDIQTFPPKITPLFVMLVDVGGDSALFTVVPGTFGATSVAVQDSDAIVYSVRADSSRLHRRVLSTGDTTTLVDYGPGTKGQDVQMRGARVVAIVVRPDSSEHISVTDRDTGRSYEIDAPRGCRGLALSPDGHALVVTRAGNLYRFTLP